MNQDREQFGEGRLLAAIKKHGHLSANDFSRELDKEIHDFTLGAAQNDDITLVAIKEKVQPEVVLEEKRRELFRLIDEEHVPVAEACARLQVSSSTYYKYRRRVAEVGGEEGLKAARPRAGMARASLEEEAAILALVKEEPLLGAKRVTELLRSRGLAGGHLTEAAVYATLRKNGLNTREKRLEFAHNGDDRRMARLAQALTRTGRAPEGQGGGE